MNERILELAEQAKEYSKEFNLQHEVFQKKFAELIVQECTEICDEVQRRFGQYTFTARICKEEIKEHFGVEE